MAWYRIYRPQQVSDLAITPVREQLEKVLKTGRFSHAYLFAGPKGTGKTSTARILARILNEPLNTKHILAGTGPLQEPSEEDPLLQRIAQGRSQVVLELDAASHRGIDDVRSLQEQVSVVPTEGTVRVVILDEVHMLTTEAFNALLKLLEEPPERVVFILATTELHKVPATIQSRCQLIRFRQASAEEIQAVLQRIAKFEKVSLEEEELRLLVSAAQGSFRDAVKHFESVVESGAVQAALLENLQGGANRGTELLALLARRKAEELSRFFLEARQVGQNFSVLEQELFLQLQQRLHRAIDRQEPKTTVRHIVELTTHLVDRVGGYEPLEGLRLELACLEWCLKSDEPASGAEGAGSPDKGRSRSESKSSHTSSGSSPLKVEKSEELDREATPFQDNSSPPVQVGMKQEAPVSAKESLSLQEIEKAWPEFLLQVRIESQSLESLLRNSALGQIEENTLEILVDLPFHKEKLESAKYATVLRQMLRDRFHPQFDFRCTLFQKDVVQDTSEQQRSASEDQLVQAVEEALLSLENNLIYSEQNTAQVGQE